MQRTDSCAEMTGASFQHGLTACQTSRPANIASYPASPCITNPSLAFVNLLGSTSEDLTTTDRITLDDFF